NFWNVTNAARPQPAGQIKDLPGYIYNLAYTPDGSRILVHHYQTAGLYDVKSHTRIHAFAGDPKGTGIAGISLSPDGNLAAAGSGYSLRKGNGLVKDKQGNYVYFDCFVRAWETDGGQLVHQEALAMPVYYVGFTPDGRQAASGGWEPILRFWDVRGGEVKDTSKLLASAGEAPTGGGHAYRVQYSPDGRYLLTHGHDNRIVVWEAASRKKLHDWSLPEYTAMETFAPDSRHVAISLATGVTYVLRLDSPPRNAAK